MRIITIECNDEKKEKWLVDTIEKHIAKVDKYGMVDVNYLVDE